MNKSRKFKIVICVITLAASAGLMWIHFMDRSPTLFTMSILIFIWTLTDLINERNKLLCLEYLKRKKL